jgi:ATP-dependent DNA helicase RecQ
MDKQELTAALQTNFGFSTFKPGQAELLSALMTGRNAFGMLPTGGGKSLIYQMAGRLRDGLTIIVTPLLSLMQDQVARLNFAGENKVVALNSTLGIETRRMILRSLHDYKFLFISPEMLGQTVVLSAIKKVQLNLLVIDEAHTMLTWGPDFRPEYTNLPEIHAKLEKPQLLLLTATATPNMVQTLLGAFTVSKESWFVYRDSVNRANIHLHTEQLANEGLKRERLATLVSDLQGPGIIYFSSRKVATAMADWLQETTGVRVAAYHAGMENVERYRTQQQFMLGQIDVITATSAFGMGIDKDDIRYVIHYHLSNDLANYLQEIGRAGRDGQQSVAVLLYVPQDEGLQLGMIERSIPTPDVVGGVFDGRYSGAEIGQDLFDLISFYKKQNWPLSDVTHMFNQRRQERVADLLKMSTYAQSTANLRQQLLQAFEDDAPFSLTSESSGSTNLPIAALGLTRIATDAAALAGVKNWPDTVAQLFNIN